MEVMRYLLNIKSKFFQKQYAMYTKAGYTFPAIPEGFEVVDTQEAREWHQTLLQESRDSAANYYSKNTTRFD